MKVRLMKPQFYLTLNAQFGAAAFITKVGDLKLLKKNIQHVVENIL
ncbi:MAG: hypothetical protein ABIY51_07535 [Ferruginibacter sp.]